MKKKNIILGLIVTLVFFGTLGFGGYKYNKQTKEFNMYKTELKLCQKDIKDRDSKIVTYIDEIGFLKTKEKIYF